MKITDVLLYVINKVFICGRYGFSQHNADIHKETVELVCDNISVICGSTIHFKFCVNRGTFPFVYYRFNNLPGFL